MTGEVVYQAYMRIKHRDTGTWLHVDQGMIYSCSWLRVLYIFFSLDHKFMPASGTLFRKFSKEVIQAPKRIIHKVI